MRRDATGGVGVMARRTVAVVGGGCAGVLTTRELLRCGDDDDVVLVEPGEPGGGLAYGAAAAPWHLLNSRAGAMSADADDPGHFARWAGAHPDDFRPRAEYGRYLRDVFAEVTAAHPTRFTWHRARATALRPGPAGCTVTLAPPGDPGADRSRADGLATIQATSELRVDHVVLATGNPAGAHPAAVTPDLRDHPAYVADPWRPGALDAVPADAPVLLIGAGLTAVDVALTLTAGGDRSAPVLAVSRRGLLPLSHTAAAAPPLKPEIDDCARLTDVIRVVRAAAGEAADWRTVVDGLRPFLDRLWGALTPAEQDAFLRHLARPWECHRHRMAPQIALRIADLRAGGAFQVRAGGLRSLAPAAGGGLSAELADGRSVFGTVINCAGPGRLPGGADPLIAGLLATGVVRVGPHGLGLDVDPRGQVIGGAPAAISLIGPLRRGTFWETTAVPEIRAQARELALASRPEVLGAAA